MATIHVDDDKHLLSSTTTLAEPNHPTASRIYKAAEILNEPLRFVTNGIVGRIWTVLTPGEFGNYSSKPLEVARRVALACAFLPAAAVVLIASPLSAILNYAGDYCLGSDPYLKLYGSYMGHGSSTFATWNMASLVQPRTLVDGVEDSTHRLRAIANKLGTFHFVCGQEVDGAAARFFAHELKDHFKEFIFYLGKSNTPFLPSGLFFASKEPVLSVHVLPFQGSGVQTSIHRLLAVFELQDYYVATMHLDSGEDNSTHLEEINQAKSLLLKLPKPVILCGDFNESRYGQPTEAYQSLTENFVDCIKEEHPNEEIITCDDILKIERFGSTLPPTKLSIDYITYNRNQALLNTKFLDATFHFDLSDHKLVSGEILNA